VSAARRQRRQQHDHRRSAGVDFVVANTDAQALTMSKAAQRIDPDGRAGHRGLGAGSQPEVGRAAARRSASTRSAIIWPAPHGASSPPAWAAAPAPVLLPSSPATARDMGILTVGVVTKPFHFEGQRRMRTAEAGIAELHKVVDTLIVIPNQNLFRVANEKTTFADAFAMADQVLYSGVACITDLMVKEGLINLDFADVRAVMREMGKAMMGTGEATGEKRALTAAEAAIANPLLDDSSMKGARGLLISITGGKRHDPVRSRRSRDPHPRGSRFRRQHHRRRHLRRSLEGVVRVSVVATGIDAVAARPIVRPSIAIPAAPVQQTVAVQQPAPVAQQPVVQQQVAQPVQQTSDSIAEAIRAAELERELFLSMPRGGATAPVQQAQDDFRPQSKLFAGAPVEQQPIVQAAPVQRAIETPVYQQPVAQAPVRQEPIAPVIRQQAEQVRMPRVEDFPPMVKAEAEHRAQPVQHEERGPMGLLKRITNSLARREEEPHDVASDMTAGAPAAASQQRRPLSPEASVYAPRRAAPLDDRARAASQPRAHEDDQLEIPAFLRRQSN
jgi:cell division protein FtsZ